MTAVLKFIYEVKHELDKVIWPKYAEWTGATLVVLIVVLFFSLYLGFLDMVLLRLAQFIFDYFGA
ncbi:MAG: preprotein translocase subunit SecE [Candidatus Babeliales bacterium]